MCILNKRPPKSEILEMVKKLYRRFALNLSPECLLQVSAHAWKQLTINPVFHFPDFTFLVFHVNCSIDVRISVSLAKRPSIFHPILSNRKTLIPLFCYMSNTLIYCTGCRRKTAERRQK